MSNRNLGIAVIVIGVLVMLVCIFADAIGIGGQPGIGWKQMLGAGVGAAVFIAGIVISRRK